MIQRPFHKRAFYNVLRAIFRLTGVVLYRFRFHGADKIPREGGGLVCANHQSNLDPAVVGMCFSQRINYLAKQTLFKFPLSIIINLLDGIPIDRSGMGIAGIKETLKRAKRGELILIFPEGQRTFDGEMLEFMAGFVTVAKRTKVPLIPVGLDGSFHAWPRTTLIPKPGTIHVVFDYPVQPEEYLDLSDEEIVQLLESRIQKCFKEARKRRQLDLWQ